MPFLATKAAVAATIVGIGVTFGALSYLARKGQENAGIRTFNGSDDSPQRGFQFPISFPSREPPPNLQLNLPKFSLPSGGFRLFGSPSSSDCNCKLIYECSTFFGGASQSFRFRRTCGFQGFQRKICCDEGPFFSTPPPYIALDEVKNAHALLNTGCDHDASEHKKGIKCNCDEHRHLFDDNNASYNSQNLSEGSFRSVGLSTDTVILETSTLPDGGETSTEPSVEDDGVSGDQTTSATSTSTAQSTTNSTSSPNRKLISIPDINEFFRDDKMEETEGDSLSAIPFLSGEGNANRGRIDDAFEENHSTFSDRSTTTVSTSTSTRKSSIDNHPDINEFFPDGDGSDLSRAFATTTIKTTIKEKPDITTMKIPLEISPESGDTTKPSSTTQREFPDVTESIIHGSRRGTQSPQSLLLERHTDNESDIMEGSFFSTVKPEQVSESATKLIPMSSSTSSSELSTTITTNAPPTEVPSDFVSERTSKMATIEVEATTIKPQMHEEPTTTAGVTSNDRDPFFLFNEQDGKLEEEDKVTTIRSILSSTEGASLHRATEISGTTEKGDAFEISSQPSTSSSVHGSEGSSSTQLSNMELEETTKLNAEEPHTTPSSTAVEITGMNAIMEQTSTPLSTEVLGSSTASPSLIDETTTASDNLAFPTPNENDLPQARSASGDRASKSSQIGNVDVQPQSVDVSTTLNPYELDDATTEKASFVRDTTTHSNIMQKVDPVESDTEEFSTRKLSSPSPVTESSSFMSLPDNLNDNLNSTDVSSGSIFSTTPTPAVTDYSTVANDFSGQDLLGQTEMSVSTRSPKDSPGNNDVTAGTLRIIEVAVTTPMDKVTSSSSTPSNSENDAVTTMSSTGTSLPLPESGEKVEPGKGTTEHVQSTTFREFSTEMPDISTTAALQENFTAETLPSSSNENSASTVTTWRPSRILDLEVDKEETTSSRVPMTFESTTEDVRSENVRDSSDSSTTSSLPLENEEKAMASTGTPEENSTVMTTLGGFKLFDVITTTIASILEETGITSSSKVDEASLSTSTTQKNEEKTTLKGDEGISTTTEEQATTSSTLKRDDVTSTLRSDPEKTSENPKEEQVAPTTSSGDNEEVVFSNFSSFNSELTTPPPASFKFIKNEESTTVVLTEGSVPLDSTTKLYEEATTASGTKLEEASTTGGTSAAGNAVEETSTSADSMSFNNDFSTTETPTENSKQEEVSRVTVKMIPFEDSTSESPDAITASSTPKTEEVRRVTVKVIPLEDPQDETTTVGGASKGEEVRRVTVKVIPFDDSTPSSQGTTTASSLLVENSQGTIDKMERDETATTPGSMTETTFPIDQSVTTNIPNEVRRVTVKVIPFEESTSSPSDEVVSTTGEQEELKRVPVKIIPFEDTTTSSKDAATTNRASDIPVTNPFEEVLTGTSTAVPVFESSTTADTMSPPVQSVTENKTPYLNEDYTSTRSPLGEEITSEGVKVASTETGKHEATTAGSVMSTGDAIGDDISEITTPESVPLERSRFPENAISGLDQTTLLPSSMSKTEFTTTALPERSLQSTSTSKLLDEMMTTTSTPSEEGVSRVTVKIIPLDDPTTSPQDITTTSSSIPEEEKAERVTVKIITFEDTTEGAGEMTTLKSSALGEVTTSSSSPTDGIVKEVDGISLTVTVPTEMNEETGKTTTTSPQAEVHRVTVQVIPFEESSTIVPLSETTSSSRPDIEMTTLGNSLTNEATTSTENSKQDEVSRVTVKVIPFKDSTSESPDATTMSSTPQAEEVRRVTVKVIPLEDPQDETTTVGSASKGEEVRRVTVKVIPFEDSTPSSQVSTMASSLLAEDLQGTTDKAELDETDKGTTTTAATIQESTGIETTLSSDQSVTSSSPYPDNTDTSTRFYSDESKTEAMGSTSSVGSTAPSVDENTTGTPYNNDALISTTMGKLSMERIQTSTEMGHTETTMPASPFQRSEADIVSTTVSLDGTMIDDEQKTSTAQPDDHASQTATTVSQNTGTVKVENGRSDSGGDLETTTTSESSSSSTPSSNTTSMSETTVVPLDEGLPSTTYAETDTTETAPSSAMKGGDVGEAPQSVTTTESGQNASGAGTTETPDSSSTSSSSSAPALASASTILPDLDTTTDNNVESTTILELPQARLAPSRITTQDQLGVAKSVHDFASEVMSIEASQPASTTTQVSDITTEVVDATSVAPEIISKHVTTTESEKMEDATTNADFTPNDTGSSVESSFSTTEFSPSLKETTTTEQGEVSISSPENSHDSYGATTEYADVVEPPIGSTHMPGTNQGTSGIGNTESSLMSMSTTDVNDGDGPITVTTKSIRREPDRDKTVVELRSMTSTVRTRILKIVTAFWGGSESTTVEPTTDVQSVAPTESPVPTSTPEPNLEIGVTSEDSQTGETTSSKDDKIMSMDDSVMPIGDHTTIAPAHEENEQSTQSSFEITVVPSSSTEVFDQEAPTSFKSIPEEPTSTSKYEQEPAASKDVASAAETTTASSIMAKGRELEMDGDVSGTTNSAMQESADITSLPSIDSEASTAKPQPEKEIDDISTTSATSSLDRTEEIIFSDTNSASERQATLSPASLKFIKNEESTIMPLLEGSTMSTGISTTLSGSELKVTEGSTTLESSPTEATVSTPAPVAENKYSSTFSPNTDETTSESTLQKSEDSTAKSMKAEEMASTSSDSLTMTSTPREDEGTTINVNKEDALEKSSTPSMVLHRTTFPYQLVPSTTTGFDADATTINIGQEIEEPATLIPFGDSMETTSSTMKPKSTTLSSSDGMDGTTRDSIVVTTESEKTTTPGLEGWSTTSTDNVLSDDQLETSTGFDGVISSQSAAAVPPRTTEASGESSTKSEESVSKTAPLQSTETPVNEESTLLTTEADIETSTPDTILLDGDADMARVTSKSTQKSTTEAYSDEMKYSTTPFGTAIPSTTSPANTGDAAVESTTMDGEMETTTTFDFPQARLAPSRIIIKDQLDAKSVQDSVPEAVLLKSNETSTISLSPTTSEIATTESDVSITSPESISENPMTTQNLASGKVTTEVIPSHFDTATTLQPVSTTSSATEANMITDDNMFTVQSLNDERTSYPEEDTPSTTSSAELSTDKMKEESKMITSTESSGESTTAPSVPEIDSATTSASVASDSSERTAAEKGSSLYTIRTTSVTSTTPIPDGDPAERSTTAMATDQEMIPLTDMETTTMLGLYHGGKPPDMTTLKDQLVVEPEVTSIKPDEVSTTRLSSESLRVETGEATSTLRTDADNVQTTTVGSQMEEATTRKDDISTNADVTPMADMEDVTASSQASESSTFMEATSTAFNSGSVMQNVTTTESSTTNVEFMPNDTDSSADSTFSTTEQVIQLGEGTTEESEIGKSLPEKTHASYGATTEYPDALESTTGSMNISEPDSGLNATTTDDPFMSISTTEGALDDNEPVTVITKSVRREPPRDKTIVELRSMTSTIRTKVLKVVNAVRGTTDSTTAEPTTETPSVTERGSMERDILLGTTERESSSSEPGVQYTTESGSEMVDAFGSSSPYPEQVSGTNLTEMEGKGNLLQTTTVGDQLSPKTTESSIVGDVQPEEEIVAESTPKESDNMEISFFPETTPGEGRESSENSHFGNTTELLKTPIKTLEESAIPSTTEQEILQDTTHYTATESDTESRNIEDQLLEGTTESGGMFDSTEKDDIPVTEVERSESEQTTQRGGHDSFQQSSERNLQEISYIPSTSTTPREIPVPAVMNLHFNEMESESTEKYLPPETTEVGGLSDENIPISTVSDFLLGFTPRQVVQASLEETTEPVNETALPVLEIQTTERGSPNDNDNITETSTLPELELDIATSTGSSFESNDTAEVEVSSETPAEIHFSTETEVLNDTAVTMAPETIFNSTVQSPSEGTSTAPSLLIDTSTFNPITMTSTESSVKSTTTSSSISNQMGHSETEQILSSTVVPAVEKTVGDDEMVVTDDSNSAQEISSIAPEVDTTEVIPADDSPSAEDYTSPSVLDEVYDAIFGPSGRSARVSNLISSKKEKERLSPSSLSVRTTTTPEPPFKVEVKVGPHDSRSLFSSDTTDVERKLQGEISNVVTQLLLTTHRNFRLLPNFVQCAGARGRTGRRKTRVLHFDTDNYPWMARIGFRESRGVLFPCAGTIISRRYILTSAHCATRKSNDSAVMEILLEGAKLAATGMSDQSNYKYKVEEVIVHQNYDKVSRENDLALIRLAKEIPDFNGTSDVRPICLPFEDGYGVWDYLPGDGDTAYLGGWGYGLRNMAARIEEMEEAAVTVWPNSNCSHLYRGDYQKKITPHHICAYGKAEKDACRGDSGGPLMALMTRQKIFFQIGIVSYGPRCGYGVPGVYTRVSEYLSWILDSMRP